MCPFVHPLQLRFQLVHAEIVTGGMLMLPFKSMAQLLGVPNSSIVSNGLFFVFRTSKGTVQQANGRHFDVSKLESASGDSTLKTWNAWRN